MRNCSQLVDAVLSKSVSVNFDEAAREWKVTMSFVDPECDGTCVCGKMHLRYLYEITNLVNYNTLYPVGSECVRSFENDEMNLQMEILDRGKTIFKNAGKKHDGVCYEEICRNDPSYVEFVRKSGKKKVYEKLVKYYDASTKLL